MQFESFHWLSHHGYKLLFTSFTIVILTFSCISLPHFARFEAMKTGSGVSFCLTTVHVLSILLCLWHIVNGTACSCKLE